MKYIKDYIFESYGVNKEVTEFSEILYNFILDNLNKKNLYFPTENLPEYFKLYKYRTKSFRIKFLEDRSTLHAQLTFFLNSNENIIDWELEIYGKPNKIDIVHELYHFLQDYKFLDSDTFSHNWFDEAYYRLINLKINDDKINDFLLLIYHQLNVEIAAWIGETYSEIKEKIGNKKIEKDEFVNLIKDTSAYRVYLELKNRSILKWMLDHPKQANKILERLYILYSNYDNLSNRMTRTDLKKTNGLLLGGMPQPISNNLLKKLDKNIENKADDMIKKLYKMYIHFS